MSERIDYLESAPNPFIDSPAEYLVKQLAAELKKVPQFLRLFGDAIDEYQRMDYGIRNFPACRIYCLGYIKQYETWFINGNITIDVMFPPATRRVNLQQYQSSVSSALLQQFRRSSFFATLCDLVPGLNELGKTFEVDQEQGFIWQQNDEIVPLTQMKVNFRIDLSEWDRYLEATNRTTSDPFEQTLADLDAITTEILAMRDDNSTVELSLTSDQEV